MCYAKVIGDDIMAIGKINTTQALASSTLPQRNISKENLQLLRSQGLTLKEIADSLQVSRSTVAKYISIYGLASLRTDYSKVDQTLFDKVYELLSQGFSKQKISEILNISYGRVRVLFRHLKLKDIDDGYIDSVKSDVDLVKHPLVSKAHGAFLKSITKKDLDELVKNGHTINYIAEMLSVDSSDVKDLFTKFGIRISDYNKYVLK